MTSMSTKVRPTFTMAEMRLLSQGMELLLNRHIQAGDFQNPILLEMIRIKEYCASFKPTDIVKESQQSKLAQYIKAQGVMSVTSYEPEASQLVVSNNPDLGLTTELTDEQKFDLLKLRDESTYSEQERVFMLNVGTLIMMRRASIKPVSENDL